MRGGWPLRFRKKSTNEEPNPGSGQAKIPGGQERLPSATFLVSFIPSVPLEEERGFALDSRSWWLRRFLRSSIE